MNTTECIDCHGSMDDSRPGRKRCRGCERAIARENARRNRDRITERTRQQRQDPLWLEGYRKYRREYYFKHAEKERERSLDYQRRNEGAVRERRANLTRTKEAIVIEAKNRPCMDCGGHFPPEAMDFDHVRGVKVAAVSAMIARPYSLEALRAEMEKCEVVCANCHRIRTKNRKKANAIKAI